MNFTELSKRIEAAPALDFGAVFGTSFELFKKTWAKGVLMFLFQMLCIIPAVIVLYIPMIIAAANGGLDETNSEPPIGMLVATFVLFIPVMIFIQTFVLGITAGFYRMIDDYHQGLSTPRTDFTLYLKKPYWKTLLILSLYSFGISLAAALLCYLPLFYVLVPVALMPVIFAFNPELTPKEILKAAFALGNKKWLLLFGLTIVCGLLAEVVGLLLCGIGIFVTLSFVYLPNYIVYKESVGTQEPEDEALSLE